MKINKCLIITLLIGLCIYYITPELANGMSEDAANNFAATCILFINSVYAIISGVILTKKNGFKWYYSIVIGLLFIPEVFINYNTSTVIYSILYALEFMIGSSLYIKYSNN